MVADREGDIYPMFARRPEAIDFVVRANHDRVLAEGGTLYAVPAAWPALGRAQVKVAPKRPGNKGHTASVVLKAGTVTIKRETQATGARTGRSRPTSRPSTGASQPALSAGHTIDRRVGCLKFGNRASRRSQTWNVQAVLS
jgi:hypothetical protein